MRQPLRNQRKLWYRKPQGQQPTHDGDGYENGTAETYSTAVEFHGSLEQREGVTGDYVFGVMPEYKFVLSVPDPAFALAEGDVINYRAQPSSSTAPYDLIVDRRKSSLNSTVYGLKEADGG